MARQTARTDIRYDGTTEAEWSPPGLEDYADAMELEEVNTTGDLTAEQKRRIAAMTLMGEARASRFDELQSYPVVEATGELNRNALDAARRLRGRSSDPEGIERVTRQLLNSEFDASIERPGRTRAPSDVDLSVPSEMQAAAELGLAKKEELDLQDCGTGEGETTADQILSGEIAPGRIRDVAAYLVSHEEDYPQGTTPSGLSDEQIADGCGTVQYLLWGGGTDTAYNWALRKANAVAEEEGDTPPYADSDMRSDYMDGFTVQATSVESGKEGWFYPLFFREDQAQEAALTEGTHRHEFEEYERAFWMPDDPQTHAGDTEPDLPVLPPPDMDRSETRADVEDLSEGDMVTWDSAGGAAYGMIDTIATGDTVSGSLEPEDTEHETSEDDPGLIIELVERDEEGEIVGTGDTVFHRPETVMQINENDVPDDRSARACEGRSYQSRINDPEIRETADGTITVKVMTDQVARDGMVLDPEGLRTKDYMRNPVVLWEHGQDPRRGANLDVASKSERVYNFHHNTIEALGNMLTTAGLRHPDEFGPEHIMRRISANDIRTYRDLYHFIEPGSLIDGCPDHQLFQRYWPTARPDSFDPPNFIMTLREPGVH